MTGQTIHPPMQGDREGPRHRTHLILMAHFSPSYIILFHSAKLRIFFDICKSNQQVG